GPWRFRTGDDARYSAREYDEEAWETIPVPERWERAGHPGYDGFAWYRCRFALPVAPAGRTAYLELGKIDDVDETFVNGVKVGQTGAFPPGYRGERQGFRRCPVPADALNWGGDNVLAVRVYDGGGGGGLWSVRRERPPPARSSSGPPATWCKAWWTSQRRVGISGAACYGLARRTSTPGRTRSPSRCREACAPRHARPTCPAP